MRICASIHWLSVAMTFALLAGCSSGSANAPTMSVMQNHVQILGQRSSVLDPVAMLKLSQRPIAPHDIASYDACPAKGPLEYVSDANDGVIDIFAGKNFTSGELPCGVINGLGEPQGLAVSDHELYVADTAGRVVRRFARGATSPDMTYVDTSCGGEFPADVAIATDGTVIATDIISISCAGGQISTWKNNGTFIGNFPNAHGGNDFFLTVQRNGDVYFDDNTFTIYKGSCPAGVCGSFTATGAQMAYPGGLESASGSKSEDVVLDDQSAAGGGALTTFETFPDASWSCPLGAIDPISFAFNRTDKHAFYADGGNGVAGEVRWNDASSTCPTVATVTVTGIPTGVAVDAPGPD